MMHPNLSDHGACGWMVDWVKSKKSLVLYSVRPASLHLLLISAIDTLTHWIYYFHYLLYLTLANNGGN